MRFGIVRHDFDAARSRRRHNAMALSSSSREQPNSLARRKRIMTMTRFPSLTSSLLAATLAVLPVAAFAQQATTPVQTPAPATEVSKVPEVVTPNHAATTVQSANTDVKTPLTGKTVPVAKPDHAKLTTPAHPAPAKTAEPTKS
jgi:hypothetical protein